MSWYPHASGEASPCRLCGEPVVRVDELFRPVGDEMFVGPVDPESLRWNPYYEPVLRQVCVRGHSVPVDERWAA